MLYFCLLIVSILLALCGLYIVRNLNIWDGVLGLSIATSIVVIGIALYSALKDNSAFLDVAIAFALFGFVGTLFVAVFIYTRGDL
ncbi:MAG: monovalent cation/H+ antiporter complex subunit F [Andreesenia angusta]|nr:monovalent cation/H+ antiporter complex subunit F [Andreesenia angusta]